VTPFCKSKLIRMCTLVACDPLQQPSDRVSGCRLLEVVLGSIADEGTFM